VRLRIDLGYDGTEFSGWAAQPGRRTVQGELEAALMTVLRLPTPAALTVAGRTDAGVHARGQVSHLDVPADLEVPVLELERRLNGTLPDDIRVHRVSLAPDGFDARFSAVWRRYAYRLSDGPESADPLRRHEVLPWPWPLDLAAMNAASAELTGEHDFAAYCKRREGATTIRALLDFSWSRTPAGLVVARVVADAFCHSMVRALVGALLAVGTGRKPVSWPAAVLSAGVRDSAVQVVPARGLTLEEVGYPPDGELAARADEARRMRSPLTR
jgi:tRNA pseudouridine38-40 synthase